MLKTEDKRMNVIKQPSNELDLSNCNLTNDSLQAKLADKTDWALIDLSDNPISDVSVLAAQKSLRVLRLVGIAISDLAKIPALESLEELHLSDTPISDLTGIGNQFNNLKILYLTGTPLAKLAGIQELPALEELSLSDTNVTKKEMFALAQLTNLKKLYLEGLELDATSLLALKSLSKLEYLEVNYEPELQYAKDELFKLIKKEQSLVNTPNKPTAHKEMSDKASVNFYHFHQPVESNTPKRPVDATSGYHATGNKQKKLRQIKELILSLDKDGVIDLDNWINSNILKSNEPELKQWDATTNKTAP